MALSDLTGDTVYFCNFDRRKLICIPEYIPFADYKNKKDEFWAKMSEYREMNYLMCTSSPSHPKGDRFTNELGILQFNSNNLKNLNCMESCLFDFRC